METPHTHWCRWLSLVIVGATFGVVMIAGCSSDNRTLSMNTSTTSTTPASNDTGIAGQTPPPPSEPTPPPSAPSILTQTLPEPNVCEEDFTKVDSSTLSITVPAGNKIPIFLGITDSRKRIIPLTANPLPQGAQFSSTTDFLTFSPTADQKETSSFSLHVADCPNVNWYRNVELVVTASVVTRVNQAPVIAEIPAQELDIGQPLSLDVAVSDPEGSVIDYAFVAPAWVTITTTSSGVHISGNTSMYTIGGGAVKIIAVDDKKNASTRSFTITTKGWKPVTMSNHVGEILALSVFKGDPKIMMLASGGGIYITTDGGKTWQNHRKDFPPGLSNFNAIAMSNHDPLIAYTGTQGMSLTTFDGAASWVAATGSPGSHCGISSILPHPTDPKIIYLTGTEWDGCRSNAMGFEMSTDQGRTYVRKTGKDTANPEVTGRIPATVFADATGDKLVTIVNPANTSDPNSNYWKPYSGIYYTTNRAETWAKCAMMGLPVSKRYHDLVSNTVTKELYLATSEGIYFSADSCQSWTKLLGNDAPEIADITVTENGITYAPEFFKISVIGNRIFLNVAAYEYSNMFLFHKYGHFTATILKSPEGVVSLNPLQKVNAIANRGKVVDIGAGEYLMWGSVGLLKSTDGGYTFKTFDSKGIDNYDARPITKLPGKNGRVFVMVNVSPKVRFSDDRGETFKPLSDIATTPEQIPDEITLKSIKADRFGRVFLIGANDVAMSEDAGVTWKRIIDGRTNIATYCPITYYTIVNGFSRVETISPEKILVSCSWSRILMTPDKGATWEILLDAMDRDNKWVWRPANDYENQREDKFKPSGQAMGPMVAPTVCYANPNIIYAQYSYGGGIAKSEDGGNTFYLIDENGGKTFAPIDQNNLLCARDMDKKCRIDPVTGKRSSKGMKYGYFYLQQIDVDQQSPNCSRLYAVTNNLPNVGGCVYASSDGGETWGCSIDGYAPTNAEITRIVADQIHPGVVYTIPYVWTTYQPDNLFISTDGAQTFKPFYTTSFSNNSYAGWADMLFDTENNQIYLGSTAGLYRSTFPLPAGTVPPAPPDVPK